MRRLSIKLTSSHFSRYLILSGLIWCMLLGLNANAQSQRTVSHCLAVANDAPPVHYVSTQDTAVTKPAVKVTFVGHSTFLIETPGGIKIATDFTGFAGAGVLPDVVTMNHAHDSHYTDQTDPGIKHVLRGWNPKGGAIHHDVRIGDVHIRSVPTNIRTWAGTTEEFGNSIFIFDVAGLCIGHLGHLHHELTLQQLGQIGQLDIVFVPVDGTFTLEHTGMLKVLKQLQARLIIPMHYFGVGSLKSFLDSASANFTLELKGTPSITVSQSSLPQKPTVMVLPGN